MKLSPFLLDQWLQQAHAANPPIDYDLAASTGPVWALRELLALADEGEQARLLDTTLVYTAAAGSEALRDAIATLQGVDPDAVQVVTGAAEALLILFFLAADPGANVVLPNPGFPPTRRCRSPWGSRCAHTRCGPRPGSGSISTRSSRSSTVTPASCW